jgi:2-polyprenyl-6-methoxyphenol hydroxylase-like FAD-dependent oxidoreductase
MSAEKLETGCCIAGGGPAGMMLGFLLARAGVDVVVLEKHRDFLRDFRGDTIHPSTLEIMYELGLLEDFLKLPHQEVRVLDAQFGETRTAFADFSHLPTHCRFLAVMPQWDFLDFLAERGKRYPSFKLRMATEVTEIIVEQGRIAGVRCAVEKDVIEVRARLMIGADGRSSTMRQKAGLRVQEFGAPMDVLWFSCSRMAGDPEEIVGRIDVGQIFIAIYRGDHWQLGLVIPKGTIDAVRQQGMPAFHERIAKVAPFLRQRIDEVRDWDDVKLLTVQVNRLEQWFRPGLLCIGDAAHAMSPVGGIGINLAIQDAVAAGNILAEPLRAGRVADEDLIRVQKRRELPTRLTQGLQLMIQERVIKPTLEQRPVSDRASAFRPPLFLRLVHRFGFLRRLNGRLIGLGFRREHVSVSGVAGL